MPQLPEKIVIPNVQPIDTGLTIQQIREAVRRWEEKAGQETFEWRRKVPGWSPRRLPWK